MNNIPPFNFISNRPPQWGLGTVIKEPYSEGWRHLKGAFSAETVEENLFKEPMRMPS
jgi:hypothetical protein